MNLLVENEDGSRHSETIASVLDRMTKYAHYHFETEEALMLEYEYPEYESHRDDHTQFKMKTAQFCLDSLQRKETLPDEVISYLRHWLDASYSKDRYEIQALSSGARSPVI